MGDFFAISWPAGASADAEAARLAAQLDALAGWRRIAKRPGLSVWVQGRRPPPVRALRADLWIIGDALRRHSVAALSPAALGAAETPLEIAKALSAEAWGRYVALIVPPAGTAVVRDPSGALDCLAWRRGAVSLITSSPGALPAGLLPAHTALNWRTLAAWLVDPGATAALSALEGISVVPPGHLLRLAPGGAVPEPVWNPADFAAQTKETSRTDRERAAALVEVVDLAVEGLTAPYAGMRAEVSGGLDSAIVSASMVHVGVGSRVRAWLNYFGDRPEGDERAYAQAVADRLGFALACVAKTPAPLTEADLTELSHGLRPGLGGLDAARDRDTAQRLDNLDAAGLVSGQGGDVVFFQTPTPLIAADQVRLAGLGALRPGFVAEVARFSRRSAWSVLAAVRDDVLRRDPDPFHGPSLDGAAGSDAANPWAQAARGLPPAKRLQVTALFQAQISRGVSRRRQAGDLIYPLLSQPVMEHVLAVSTVELTEGRRDRALARRAFAERLPAAIVDRRAKGDLTAHYGRTVAASLGLLKPLLLEGCLCEAGLLDRGRLEAALTPERLIRDVHNGEILIAAAVESWVRWWQGRVPDAPSARRSRPPDRN